MEKKMKLTFKYMTPVYKSNTNFILYGPNKRRYSLGSKIGRQIKREKMKCKTEAQIRELQVRGAHPYGEADLLTQPSSPIPALPFLSPLL